VKTEPDCQPLVEFDNVAFSYGEVPALRRVNLHIHEKELAWIVGPNGGGKTTLLKLMLGLLTPDQGSVKLFGDEPVSQRHRVGYMPQTPNLDQSYPALVKDVVLMGRLGSGRGFGFFGTRDRDTVETCLDQVGLEGMSRRPFSSLSGGQQRRLFIARALASEPEILVLDEPTANLDPLVQGEMYELLFSLSKKTTVVVVSHDPTFVFERVEHVICVKQTVHVHPTDLMSDDFLGSLYGPGEMRIIRHDRHGGGHHG